MTEQLLACLHPCTWGGLREKSGAMLRRRRGKFAYRTTLSSDADAEKIDAQLADGILTVRLPKGSRPSPARSRSSP
ncbi:Hsp20/alpha crystallin family protein, partial [Mycobacterium sp.]|uniref:Hsp20/alpha crystallin family protein n=1 Tax=Mycobacterium sp. TaxID=1785 RepID=UPI002B91E10D